MNTYSDLYGNIPKGEGISADLPTLSVLRVSENSLHPSTNHGTGFLFMRAAVCKQAVACFSTLAREEMGWVGGGGEGAR